MDSSAKLGSPEGECGEVTVVKEPEVVGAPVFLIAEPEEPEELHAERKSAKTVINPAIDMKRLDVKFMRGHYN